MLRGDIGSAMVFGEAASLAEIDSAMVRRLQTERQRVHRLFIHSPLIEMLVGQGGCLPSTGGSFDKSL
jgi:hypothetical protein